MAVVTIMTNRFEGNGIISNGSPDLPLGTILVNDVMGFLDEGNNVSGTKFVGILKADAVKNDHVEYYKDQSFIYNTAAAAQTNKGELVYCAAGGTLSLAAGNGVVCGLITAVDVGVSWEITPVIKATA